MFQKYVPEICSRNISMINIFFTDEVEHPFKISTARPGLSSGLPGPEGCSGGSEAINHPQNHHFNGYKWVAHDCIKQPKNAKCSYYIRLLGQHCISPRYFLSSHDMSCQLRIKTVNLRLPRVLSMGTSTNAIMQWLSIVINCLPTPCRRGIVAKYERFLKWGYPQSSV